MTTKWIIIVIAIGGLCLGLTFLSYEEFKKDIEVTQKREKDSRCERCEDACLKAYAGNQPSRDDLVSCLHMVCSKYCEKP